MAEHFLDATGLKCPLPVLRARRALKALPVGDVLKIAATDPAAIQDFPAFCRAAGHRLLDAADSGGVYSFRIEKATTSPASDDEAG